MIQPGLVLSVAAGIVAAGVFFHVGRRQLARGARAGARTAAAAFATWWWGLAAYALLVGVVLNGLAALGVTAVAPFVALRSLATVVLCLALGGLTAYIAFLYSGRRRALAWGVLVGSATYALVFGLLGAHRAVGVLVGAFETQLVFEPAVERWKMVLVLAALTLPQTGAALALFALRARVRDATSRWRILLVASSILVWSTGAFVAGVTGDSALLLLTRPVLGTMAALASLWAYEPPAWARARFGVDAL